MDSSFISKLQQRLTEPLPGKDAQLKMAPSFRPDGDSSAKSVKAGVLILLYPNPDLYFVLMKRPEYQGVHSGQISLPGGKFEVSDASLIETAVRETYEEVGVQPETISVLGTLSPLYIPVSETEVYPAVAYIDRKPVFKVDTNEVAYLIETPVHELLQTQNRKTRPYDSGRFSGIIPYFDIQGNVVWGATAMILSEFSEIIESII
jgi:NTP pyrophosphohydrolases including oxidative damage repair enzymes